MFDVGLSEMFVIGVVALVVLGPERLPKVARTLGILFGRLQRYVAQVKSDINREMEAAELGKVKTEFENAARSFQSGIETHAAEAERGIRGVQGEVERGVAGEPGPAPSEPPAASPQLELGIDEPGAARRDPPAT